MSTKTLLPISLLLAFALTACPGQSTGTLEVVLQDAPTGASVTVNGPNTNETIVASKKFEGVVLGHYSIAAPAFKTASNDEYSATATPNDVTLDQSAPNQTVTVKFLPVPIKIVLPASAAPVPAPLTIRRSDGSVVPGVDSTDDTIPNLEPGRYTFEYGPVTAPDGFEYVPNPKNATLTVAGGSATLVPSVQYPIGSGKFNLDTRAFPAGLVVNLEIKRADGSVAYNGPSTGPIPNLPVGAYSMAIGTGLGSDGFAYAPTTSPMPLEITGGNNPPSSIAFAATNGQPNFAFTGMPAGSQAAIEIKQGGTVVWPKAGEVATTAGPFPKLDNGTYTLSIGPITTSDGNTYAANPASQTLVVAGGNNAPIAVSFVPTNAQTTFTWPPALPKDKINIAIQRDGSNVWTGTAADPTPKLELGAYTLKLAPVVGNDGFTYTPDPAAPSFSVTANGASSLAVAYKISDGQIKITTSSNPPSNVVATVTLTDPAGHNKNGTTPATFDKLVPGVYTIAGASFNANGFVYTTANKTLTVTAGKTQELDMAYMPATGKLTFSNTGLPAGLVAQIKVTNGANAVVYEGPAKTLELLEPGNYNVTAANVADNGFTFSAPSTTATISAGTTTAAAGAYTPITGKLVLSKTGLPAGKIVSATVTGPNNYSKTVALTETLEQLEPGVYTVAPTNLTDNGFTYSAPSTAATVSAGNTATAAGAYKPITGKLAFAVTGLPTGLVAKVKVVNAASVTVHDGDIKTLELPAGAYTITVPPLEDADGKYQAAAVSPQTVAVGATTTPELKYATTTGTVVVTITKAPVGANADVTVSGPAGFNPQKFTASTVLKKLAPGTYTVTATQVPQGGVVYKPTVSNPSFTLKADEQQSASVAYFSPTDQTGKINVSITNPDNVTGVSVQVTRGAYQKTVTTTELIYPLDPGAYTITPSIAPAIQNGFRYVATVSMASVNVSNQFDPSNVTATVAATTGKLALSNTGLPAGKIVSATVTGPNNYSKTVALTETLELLEPGTYTVAPTNVVDNGFTFSAPAKTATVTAGNTITTVAAYAPITGKLALSNTGLPAGKIVSATVTGPNNYSKTVALTETLELLEPGVYTLTPSAITDNGFTFSAPVKTATLSAGNTVAAVAAYTPATGKLTLSNKDLPTGKAASGKVTGPNNYSKTVTLTETLELLEPGTYTITPDNVSDNGFVFSAPSKTATVSAGNTATTEAVYKSPGKLVLNIVQPVGTTFAANPLTITVKDSTTTTKATYTAFSATPLEQFLPADTYTIAAPPISTSDGFKYSATITTSPATLESGKTTTVTIEYKPVDSKLILDVAQPAGTTFAANPLNITTAGPAGSGAVAAIKTFGTTSPITVTTAGDYTFTAPDVSTTDGYKYRASIATNPATLEFGKTKTVVVTYDAIDGKLELKATLPTGVTGTPKFEVKNATGATLAGSPFTAQTLTALPPGNYTVTAQDVETSNAKYRASVSNPIVVQAGKTTTLSATYIKITSELAVASQGCLPATTNANITVTGPAAYTSSALTLTNPLVKLEQGLYAVTPNPVVVNGTTFTAPATSATVGAAATTTNVSVAYDPTWTGATQFGSVDHDYAYKVLRNPSDCGWYVVGETARDIDGAGANTHAGKTDLYIAKYGPDGVRQAIKQYGTSDAETYIDAQLDASGNVVILGQVSKTVLTGSKEYYQLNGLLLKYSFAANTFNQVFAPINFGTDLETTTPKVFVDDTVRAMTMDANGNIFVVGDSQSTTTTGDYNALFWKFTGTGTVAFKNTDLSTATLEGATAVATDATGNVFVAGQIFVTRPRKTINGRDVEGDEDIFVAKYNNTGIRSWLVQDGSEYLEDEANEIATTTSGDVVLAGRWNRKLTGFGPSEETRYADAFVARFAGANGSKTFRTVLAATPSAGNSDANDTVAAMALDADGNAILAGRTNGNMGMGINAGLLDVFVSKVRLTDGVVQWTNQFGGSSDDLVSEMVLDAGGNVVLVGSTSGDADGAGPNSNAGGMDAWVGKINSDGTSAALKQFGGTGNEQATSLFLDATGDVVLAGQTTSVLAPTAVGYTDAFVMGFSAALTRP